MSDFTVKRGDTLSWTGVALTSAGAAQSLVGCTVRMTAKQNLSDADSDAIFSRYSPSNGITITNAAGGLFTVTVAASYTASLTRRTLLFYDVQITDGSGNVYTVDSGTIAVEMDVSVTTP